MANRTCWCSTARTSACSAPANPRSTDTPHLADLERACREAGESLGLAVEVRQTDDEAELVGWLHEAAQESAAGAAQPRCFHALLLRPA